MPTQPSTIPDRHVALLAEGVDRNFWLSSLLHLAGDVALLAEGVDRNRQILGMNHLDAGRPPRGGRG